MTVYPEYYYIELKYSDPVHNEPVGKSTGIPFCTEESSRRRIEAN